MGPFIEPNQVSNQMSLCAENFSCFDEFMTGFNWLIKKWLEPTQLGDNRKITTE